jgi:WD40 repeat protein
MVDRLNALSPERRAYTLESLSGNIAAAGQPERLQQLLLSVPYLAAKVQSLGPVPLLADFDLLTAVRPDPGPESALAFLREAVALSANAVVQDPQQFPAQLLGRLPDDATELEPILAQIAPTARSAWMRPLTRGLNEVGEPLVRTLVVGSGVTSFAVSPETGTIVTGSEDGTVRLWDIRTGQQRKVCNSGQPFSGAVAGVAVLPGRAVSVQPAEHRGGAGSLMRIWSLEDGSELDAIALPDGEGVDEVIAYRGDQLITLSVSTVTIWSAAPLARLRRVTLPPDDDDPAHGRIGTVAVSPDGRLLALTEWRGVPNLLDLQTGCHLRRLADEAGRKGEFLGMVGSASSVAFLPDSTGLVAPGGRDVVDVWDLATGERRAVLSAGAVRAPIRALAVTPSGRRVLGGTNSGELVLWSLGSEREPLLVRAHGRAITGICVTSEQEAISSSSEGSLRVWRLDRMDQPAHPDDEASAERGHSDAVQAAIVTASGTRGVTASPREFRVWDLATGQQVSAFAAHRKWTTELAALPAGERFASIGSEGDDAFPEGTLSVWDPAGRRLASHTNDRIKELEALAVSPDGGTAVTSFHIDGGQEHVYGVLVWSLPAGKVVAQESAEQNRLFSRQLALGPDGTQALSADRSQIVVWDTRTCHVTGAFTEHQDEVTCLAVASGTSIVLSGDAAGKVIVWSLNELAARGVLTGARGVRRLAVTADGRRAVVGWDDGSVVLWDLESLTRLASFSPDGQLIACALDPAGETVILGDDLGRVHILAVSPPWPRASLQRDAEKGGHHARATDERAEQGRDAADRPGQGRTLLDGDVRLPEGLADALEARGDGIGVDALVGDPAERASGRRLRFDALVAAQADVTERVVEFA